VRDDLYHLLVDSVRDYAIFLVDVTGRVASWNVGAERIKQYRADEIIGKHISIFHLPEDVRRGRPNRALRIAAEEGKFEDEAWRLRKDGTRFWANVTITALRDKSGTLVAFAKVTRDLTERKRAEEERLRLVERAQTADAEARAAALAVRLRDEFLAVAAHELKTPLTSLLGNTQLSLRRLDTVSDLDRLQMRRTLEMIEAQARRSARLVAQLFDVAQLETGQLRIHPENTDVGQLAADVVSEMRAIAEPSHLVVRLPGDRPVLARVDPVRTSQVLGNLIDNAIKYSPQRGEIVVEVTREAPDQVQLSVTDHGLGVPPEHRPHLFDRYFQAHQEEHRSGMGLGLFVARQIVELHGGTIDAEFPDEGGTRIIVTLPAAGP